MPVLDWIGKDKVVNHHNEVPYQVLEPQYSYGEPDSGNMIIHGDNLSALKSLLPQYEGRIKCIYIDPPYNTGNEGWVYNDNVNDPRIKAWLGKVVGAESEDLSRHDKWLCMMYPRLKLLHRLLAEDGVIFISIDDNEKFYLKLICDEIFGARNFIKDIAVINNLKGRSDDKYIATAHESLLVYKRDQYITNGVEMPDEYDDEYKLSDQDGRYRLQGLRKRGAGAKREDRPKMYYPFFYREKDKLLSLEKIDDSIEIFPHLSDGTDGRWRWAKPTSIERINELVAQKVKGRDEYDIFQKDYLPPDGRRKVKPKSFWSGTEFSAETGTLQVKSILWKDAFETPKPTGLIDYIIQQAVNNSEIILDSFAGSGTTAHAVLNMNKQNKDSQRKFILIEMEDYADTITAERVKRVIDGYGEGKKAVEGTGGGFTFYELGEKLLNGEYLNENVGLDKIREYIYFTETKQPVEDKAEEPHYLGTFIDTAYYFYYDKENVTTLDRDFLHTIKTKATHYVIYADKCILSDTEREKYNITFKKIPRDITRL